MRHQQPFAIFTLALLLSATMPNFATAGPEQTGQWELVNPLPFFPVHTHLLPTGKMMVWPGDWGISGNNPWSWDPVNQNVSPLAQMGYDAFCVGHTFLADGELFLAGGHISNNVGLSQTSKYDPVNNTWTNLPNMNAGRWYPTTTTLDNGDVLIVSGSIDLTLGGNPLPQVYEAATGTIRSLTDALLVQDLYPRMFLAPTGQVFNPAPAVETRYLDTTGTGAWSFVANRTGGYRDYGSAVMYGPGKILVMGGGDPPTNTAEVIDLSQSPPTWRGIAPMQYIRRHNNATLLPDGTVLVTGGTSSPGFNDPTLHIDAAELWDPATETWTTLASSSGIPRVYHSTALLLPDGRVLSTGGNSYPDTEIFSPPYLFKGSRPTITSAPTNVVYGDSFFIETPDASAITKITMIRLGSVTHAFNQSQYINSLSFSPVTGGITATAPPNGRVAPRGPYLLFALNGNGVPSVAKIVQLGGNSPPPVYPDVVVTAVSYANGVFTSTVANQGNAATPSGTIIGVGYSVDGVWKTCGWINGPLAAGNTVTIDSNCGSSIISSGTHTITALVDDANRFLESNETNNQFTTSITVGPPPLPDVVVTSVSYANGVFTSTVKNQGNAATPSGSIIGVGYWVDDVWKTCGWINGPLAAGSTVTINSNCGSFTVSGGTHTITAVVDDINRFTESDETNNQLTQTVTVDPPAPLPDVVVTTLSYANGIFTSTVKNQGNATTPAGTIIGVAFLVDDVWKTCGWINGPLAAGSIITINSNCGSFTISGGTHTITAVVDDVNRFAELDETNNQLTQTVTVDPPAPLPDVVVTTLSYANGVFTSTVKNQGNAATPAGIIIGVAFLVDDVYKTCGWIDGPLATGSTVTINSNCGSFTVSAGTHTISAVVDDVNRIVELDETNNQLTQSISVP